MESKARILRFPTLRIVDLLGTRVQSVRLELVSPHSKELVRLGTWLVYLPLMMVGYLLALAGLLRLVAGALGWSATLFIFGTVHLLAGAMGAVFGRELGSARTDDVFDPALDSRVGVAEIHKEAAARKSTPSGKVRSHDDKRENQIPVPLSRGENRPSRSMMLPAPNRGVVSAKATVDGEGNGLR